VGRLYRIQRQSTPTKIKSNQRFGSQKCGVIK
jgi:hypothetical protein